SSARTRRFTRTSIDVVSSGAPSHRVYRARWPRYGAVLLLALQLEDSLARFLAILVMRPFRSERVLVHEGERGAVHVHVLVRFQVRRLDELECDLVIAGLGRGLHV